MSDAHHEEREALGAYMLGALDAAERHAVEAHLAACPDCRDELSRLSALPPLLGRLSEAEAREDLLLPSHDLAPRIVLAAGAEAVRLRRRVRRWQAVAGIAAAVAAVLAVVLADPFGGGGDEPTPLVAAVVPVAAEAGGTGGTATAYAWEWGTTVELQVTDLPTRDQYVLYAIDDAGRRQQTGTWGPTAARAAHVRSATAIPQDSLRRVEVTDPDGRLLFAFDF